jgi:decaprenylphospho-beta-D-ribofuranose 2-oxidase
VRNEQVEDIHMTPSGEQDIIMNWSMTQRSPCFISKARDITGIIHALNTARAWGLTVIPHGTGHSYTDAALNTRGLIIDVTGMKRILAWDPEHGIMQVEPGVTMRDVVRVALPDRWWPAVTPSTADATIGGCLAMNVNGKNAWQYGSFGEHVLSLTMLLANGQVISIAPESDPQLFQAVVGSAGLLGIITSVTLQLQRISSGSVDIRMQPAASIGEILALLQEEQSADFLEAWVDGFASGRQLGRGIVTCASYSEASDDANLQPSSTHVPDWLTKSFARCAGTIGRPVVTSGVQFANRMTYWWCKHWGRKATRHQTLFQSTFYSPALFSGYRSLLPHGTETFQAFVPRNQAESLFEEILRRSQEGHFMPLWCIIKQHRQDPFLLSYQVDGYSLEVNYQIVPQSVERLRKMLWELMNLVIEAGGKFYLAKDSLLTNTLYRRSVGDAAVDTFLQLKEACDPDRLFQSDMFRRVFVGENYCSH